VAVTDDSLRHGGDPVPSGEQLTRRALNGLLWALAQNWGNRLLTFLLFLILARLLSPDEIGLASTVAMILLVLGFVAEFGYGQAIIQKPALAPRDVTLPFLTSLVLSLVIAVAMVVFRDQLAAMLGVPGVAPLMWVAALSLPLATLSAFQEAFYKRALDYRMLAIRMLVATVLSGIVGISAAVAGLGALSLVLQALTLVLVSAVWLWVKPRWTPVRAVEASAWASMSLYSANVVGSRLIEFGTTRMVDILVLSQFGVAWLGIYTVGARVYQTLMQVLTSALTDVSMSALSRVADDQARLASSYLKSAAIGALAFSPAFMLLAVTADEVTILAFGAKWTESAALMPPLMVLGAVQSVQFINGSYFSALGNPRYVLLMSAIKAAVFVGLFLAFGAPSVAAIVAIFAVSQLSITPLTYALVARLLGLDLRAVAAAIRGLLFSGLAALAVFVVKTAFLADVSLIERLLATGAVFTLCYAALVALFARSQLKLLAGFIAARRGRPAAA